MKLRIFFITHHLGKSQKCQRDFDHDTPIDKAKQEIWTEFGRIAGSIVPKSFAEIISHTFIHPDREKAQLETFKAIDESLMPAMMLRECVSYRPGYRGKK